MAKERVHGAPVFRLVVPLLLWLLMVRLVQSAEPAAPPDYRVGLARRNVTPDYPVRLNGFGGRREESAGVTQPLWAKAIAIQQGDAPAFVLITLDNLGVRQSMVNAVAARLQQELQLPRQNVVLTFSHTHTAPKVNGASDTIFSTPIPADHQAHIDLYTTQLTTWLYEVARDAVHDLQPATLRWSTGTVTFAQNRRTPDGPVDHQLPILAVYRPDGTVRGVLATYACHCVTLSHNQISGDWAGYAQQALEQAMPGALALISIGCGSDANPSSGVTGDNVAAAAEQGAEIAREVQRLLQRPMQEVHGAITATLRSIELPLQPIPSRADLEMLAKEESPAGYNAQFQLQRILKGETLPAAIDYPIQTWSFGDSLSMVFLAGEVCVDYALRLRQELAADRLWIHGYANDFCAYIPSERLLQEGGYGGGAEVVYFALPAMLAPGLEQKIVEAVRQQVPSRFVASAARDGEAAGEDGKEGALEPLESLARIRVAPRFRIELVAAEPLVVDPVAIDFANDGSLWVCEMNDYPRALDGSTPPRGKIVRLVDKDHDGTYDQRQVFWDNVPFPSGITVWGKGVLICSAPYVYYAEDTTGDGVADVRQVLLQGFAETNDHARFNGFRLGLDHWLHGANGLISGQIKGLPDGPELDIAGRDFRFVPFTKQLAPLSGLTQYGRVRDDWGNWFGCENLVLAAHYPLAEDFVEPSPHLPQPSSVHPLEPTDAAHRLHPLGETVRFELSGGLGDVTSACGIEVYRDVLLGEDLYGDLFTCEPVNQLVHRMKRVDDDITFAGTRVPEEQDREFLASDDQWFRPVQARTGPDGALWIVDMYRYVIEHPRWIPEEVVRDLKILAGNDRGRIYRVVPVQGALRAWPQFDGKAAEIVRQLDSPNGMTRDMVHRHLLHHRDLWRHDLSVVSALRSVAQESSHAAARAQGLCLLHALEALTSTDVERGVSDRDAGVRYQALRLAHLPDGPQTDRAQMAKRLAEDPSLKVRWQLAFQSQKWDSSTWRAEILSQIAMTDHESTYLRHAILSGLDAQSLSPFVARLLDGTAQAGSATQANGSESRPEVIRWLAPLAQLSVVYQAADALQRLVLARGLLPDGRPPLETWELVGGLMGPQSAWVLQHLPELPSQTAGGWLTAARGIVAQPDAPTEWRVAALELLGRVAEANEADTRVLVPLLSPQTAEPITRAALAALARSDSADGLSAITEAWGGLTPVLRRFALEQLLERKAAWPGLADALRAGTILPSQLDAQMRQALFQHPDPLLRQTFEKLDGANQESDRQAVVNRYIQEASHQAASPEVSARGREQFRKHCSACHKLQGEGFEVGPDLASLSYRSIPALAQSVFDPNRAVEERYQVYQVVRTDGRIASGILKETTDTTVRLLAQNGQMTEIRRDEIELLSNNGLSLMPVGLEKDITAQQFSDIVAYLLEHAPAPKVFAGNTPQVIEPSADGSFQLSGERAEIYGEQIEFVAKAQKISSWRAERDEVVWTIRVPAGKTYRVEMEWACTDNSAGNQVVCEGLGAPLFREVDSTGGFEKFETVTLGTRYLTAGDHRVALRPARPLIRSHVMDLRGMKLIPALEP